MRGTYHSRLKQQRASQAAMLVAAASIPNTYQKSLMKRKTTDQGALTGATMALNYLIISTLRNLIENVADGMAGTKNSDDDNYKAHARQQTFALVLDILILSAGVYGQKRFAQREDEGDGRAVARTASTWLKYAAIAGISISILDVLLAGGPKSKNKKMGAHRVPLGLVGGTGFAVYTEFRRRQSLKHEVRELENETNLFEALGIGLGVLATMGAAEAAEDAVADVFSKQVNKLFPGSEDFFWGVGHATALTGTALGIVSLVRQVYRKIESGAGNIEAAYLTSPESKMVSGSPDSIVSWETLSREGRRFVSSAIPTRQIRDVMGAGPAKEPIRIYAGLDSAPTERERLDLVVAELDRTKAFERKIIMLVSPTGTGYVNYVAVESAELMSRGDIATAALQYSKRPSPMSLDRVPEGRLQFRMLVKAVSERIAKRPQNDRPKLVIFGESLGAWTSQDAFIDQGTDGLKYAGIESAIWIGTPYGSKWKSQVLGTDRPDVEKELIFKADNISDYMMLPPDKRQRVKYMMLTHHNDPVALFNLGLIVREPDWLKDPAKRPPTVSHSQYYTSPGTFMLTLIDMGNAMNITPGKFEANGHDYRADLADFVRNIYGFKVSDSQMSRIEDALRQNELDRAARLKEQAKDK